MKKTKEQRHLVLENSTLLFLKNQIKQYELYSIRSVEIARMRKGEVPQILFVHEEQQSAENPMHQI